MLDECLASTHDDLSQALPLFSKQRANEAKSLVEFQAGFDYDAKTTEGFLRFILPLILDGVFHKHLPRLFAPNGIRLLQDHTYTYSGVRARKRRDRALQLLLIGGVVGVLGKVGAWVVRNGVRVLLN